MIIIFSIIIIIIIICSSHVMQEEKLCMQSEKSQLCARLLYPRYYYEILDSVVS